MKTIILCAQCLLLAGATVAQAAMTPLVKLTFDDAPPLTTTNLGSLTGTQVLNGYNGWGAKDSISPSAPTTFDSDVSWWSMFVATNPPATYGSYQLPAMSATTVAFWVNPGHMLSWRNVFASNDTGGNAGANMMLGASFEKVDATTGNLHFVGAGGADLAVANVLTVGTWTHVAVSYDSAGGTKIYVNGVDTAFTGVWSGSIAAGTAGITIGTPGADYYGFNGLLDNLFVYNSALSQGEVQSLMMTNTIPEPAALGLLALGLFGLVSRRARK